MTPSRTTTTVPGSPRPLLATSFLFQPHQILIVTIQTHYGSLEASQSFSDRLISLQDHQLCSRSIQFNTRYSMPIAATPHHHYHYISLQNYHEPVYGFQITLNNQDILQNHQHCSKPTTTFPGQSNLIIPSIPDHRHDQTSLQNYHGPVQVSQTTLNIQDLRQDHRLFPSQLRPFLASYLFQPVQAINAINLHSMPSMGHSKLPRAFLVY